MWSGRHLSVPGSPETLGVSWNAANATVLDEGRRVLIDEPRRFDAAFRSSLTR